jgi:hypothetical protein
MGRSVLAGVAVALITAATFGANAPLAAAARGASTHAPALPGLSKAQRTMLRSVFATMVPRTSASTTSRTAREIGASRAAAIAVRPFPDEHALAASLLRLSSTIGPNGDYWVVALTTQDVRFTGGRPPVSSTTPRPAPTVTKTKYSYALVDAKTAKTLVVLNGTIA